MHVVNYRRLLLVRSALAGCILAEMLGAFFSYHDETAGKRVGGGGGVGGVKALQVKLGTHFSVWGVDF